MSDKILPVLIAGERELFTAAGETGRLQDRSPEAAKLINEFENWILLLNFHLKALRSNEPVDQKDRLLNNIAALREAWLIGKEFPQLEAVPESNFGAQVNLQVANLRELLTRGILTINPQGWSFGQRGLTDDQLEAALLLWSISKTVADQLKIKATTRIGSSLIETIIISNSPLAKLFTPWVKKSGIFSPVLQSVVDGVVPLEEGKIYRQTPNFRLVAQEPLENDGQGNKGLCLVSRTEAGNLAIVRNAQSYLGDLGSSYDERGGQTYIDFPPTPEIYLWLVGDGQWRGTTAPIRCLDTTAKEIGSLRS